MTTLALLLTGPLQSWGVRSTFDERDTYPYPTRSGILGLLAAARGIERHQPLPEQWASLELLVRRDRPGRVLTDYHTVGGGRSSEEQMVTAERKRRKSAVITRRAYLADAAFTAFLAGPSPLVDELAQALRVPRWAPYLGRRGCPPALPILLGTGTSTPLRMAQTTPLYLSPREVGMWEITALHDVPPEERGAPDVRINDVPVARSPHNRAFLTRGAVELPIDPPAKGSAGTGMHGYATIAKAIEEER
ncbi:type I-E CRISPR-associated protein Cas5/CasD [Allosalinactinospora lopnorensis]|uniref:type I-E CRISPR-associated protein Cas5/CasD n=1 Tax=Allosalinactinospora lopnorensis TaxID=1352348 RepID=UPI000623EA72|nr:type I-E CRISPR-associated protein Cas5/CasD [Allosalinactinospora lopnorensis]